MPRITVVLPVYNHENYVGKTLDSLFAQDYADFRIIAVDDGSTDGSLAVLNSFGDRIDVLKSDHGGPAAARNLAIQATDSEFIAFMDADDLCEPERFRLSIEKIARDDIDLVATAMRFVDSDSMPLPGIWRRPPEAANDLWGSLLERNWIGTPTVTVRRNALDRAGWFDEAFSHSEDYDLWLRIGAEHRIGFIETPLIQCRRHALNTSIEIGSHQNFERLALQKVDRRRARAALARLHDSAERRAEAWIWFLLRSGDARFLEEAVGVLDKHPESESLRFALGVFQHDAGWYREAIRTFSVLKARDSASVNNIGVLMSLCGDSETALFHLQSALQSRPDYYDARYNLDALKNGDRLRLTRRPFRAQPIAMIRS